MLKSSIPKEYLEKIHRLAREHNPGNLEILKRESLQSADFYTSLDWDSAERALNKIDRHLEDTPDNASLLAIKGTIHLKMATNQEYADIDSSNNLSTARNAFRRAIKYDPFNARAYYGLGGSYQFTAENKNLEEGIACLDSSRILASGRLATIATYRQAILHLRLQQPQKALALFRRLNAEINYIKSNKHMVLTFEALEIQHIHLMPSTPTNDGLLYEDGTRYAGPVVNKKPHGKGVMSLYTGATLTANFEGGVAQGQGELISSSGERYQGQFVDGAASGKGTLIYYNAKQKEKKRAEGEFFYGLKHGKIAMSFSNGQVDRGNYWMDMGSGDFEIIHASGEKRTLTRVRGKSKIALGNGKFFIGPINKKFQAHGSGNCMKEGDNKSRPCIYLNGQPSSQEALTQYNLDKKNNKKPHEKSKT